MDIKVPHLAENINTGIVASILVQEGDVVEKDQTVMELDTEKAVAPIPAEGPGKVSKIFVSEGDSVNVGQVVVQLDGAGGASAAPKTPSEPQQAAAPIQKPVVQQQPTSQAGYQYQSPSGFPPPASPTLRRMARELGIDLSRIRGSEEGGRIVVADLRDYIQFLQAGGASSAPQQVEASGPKPIDTDFSKWGEIEKKPMTTLRKKISEKMVESWTTVPHVTQYEEADITGLMELRKKHKSKYEKEGVKLTLTSFILKAVIQVLQKHPIFNATIDVARGEIIIKKYINMGIAVDTENGLIVPVIKNIDKKNLKELSLELAELATKTRDRKVGIDDLVGGTFTISNQGGIGGTHFTPIINTPEVAILGLGRGVQKPAAVNGKVEVRTLLPLCLSYDHRLIDGGSAARFIKDLLETLENFKDKDI